MNNKRINEPIRGGTLASDLFGKIHEPVKTPTIAGLKKEAEKLRKPFKVRRENPARIPREIFPEIRENSSQITAVWPFITNEAFTVTMDNYRVYISRYNEMIKAKNAEIEKYNAEVDDYIKNSELDAVQKKYPQLFLLNNNGKKPAQFNELAEHFNKEFGMLIRKRPLTTVKYASELVFKQILHIYTSQLNKQTSEYIKLGTTEAKPLKKLEINAWHITELRRNEVASIDVCIQTIRNHRERLEEAGVLIGYIFRGHEKGVWMDINPQIISIFDAKTQKYASAEYQRFTPETHKEFVDKQIVYKTNKRNIKKKENGGADSPEKGTASPGLSFVFYRNIPRQDAKSDAPGGAENVKVLTLSEKLSANVLPAQDLAIRLAGGEFNSYTPIDIRHFHKEAYNGSLTREEFKEVVVQEFFKNAAKLWRNSTPFPGSWKKAINSWMEKQFMFSNGNETGTYNKSLMVDKLSEFRWRIQHAHKWFLKSGVKRLYPSDYFDFTRQEKQEIGFEYTKKAWQNHLKYLETKPLNDKKKAKNAEMRKRQINHSKKFETALNRFIKNRITFEDLFDYVTNNLPPEFSGKLSETLLKLAASKVSYSIFDAPTGEC